MGCTGSSEKKDDKKIDGNFEYINIVRFDTVYLTSFYISYLSQFFRDASNLLQAAEEIRSGIEDAKEEGEDITETWQLKEPKYVDIVQVLFWAASAENKGRIVNTDLDITNEAPFVKMNGSKITNETYTLYQTFSNYLKALIDGPKSLKDVVEKLQIVAEQIPTLITEGKDEIQKSSLGFADK